MHIKDIFLMVSFQFPYIDFIFSHYVVLVHVGELFFLFSFMTLSLILEWGVLFLLIGVGIYTLFVIKNEKIKFKNRSLSFKKFKIPIPEIWQAVSNQDDNELHFRNNDLNSDWECWFLWHPAAKIQEIDGMLEKFISDKKIVFDDSTFVTPSMVLGKELEILRIEGPATVDRIERHYCDCFIFREKETGAYLYVESRGPILNGFLMAFSFEETIRNIKMI